MIKALLFDFSRVLLFPKDITYQGSLNTLHKQLSATPGYNFLEYFELDEGLLNFLDSIKDKYPLYIFTSESIQEALEIKPRLDSTFSRVFSAEKMGLTKKDSKAYEYIAQQLGLTPDEILFVDDSNENIEAAKEAHVNVFLYKDFSSLRERITQILENGVSQVIFFRKNPTNSK